MTGLIHCAMSTEHLCVCVTSRICVCVCMLVSICLCVCECVRYFTVGTVSVWLGWTPGNSYLLHLNGSILMLLFHGF